MSTTTAASPSALDAAPALGMPPGPGPAQIPITARRLGYSSALPFIAGALLVWLVRDEAHFYTGFALAAYAAVIVSFLGGIHWGFAMRQAVPDRRLLLWGVVPALVAWPAVIMPASAGLVILGAMVVACYMVDRRQYPVQGVAHWLTLRFRLSAVAALSCFLGAAGS